MSVSLTSNFLLNARGLVFADGGGLVWSFNKNTNTLTATGGSGGVLSSVGLSDGSTSPIYTVGSSPLTVNGTITITLNTQAANKVFAGPTTGVNAQPTFRSLVAADVPALPYVVSIGSSNLTVGGTASVPAINLSTAQVTNIGLGGTALQSASVVDSITGAGTSGSPLQLVGDTAAPGNSKFYGTNSSGTRGWFADLTAAAASGTVGLTAVTGSTGNYMDAGSAPALSQAITPTMTGKWTFTVAGAAVLVQNDTGLLQFRNTAGTEVAQAGTLKSWLGSGTNVTDFSLGSVAAFNLFASASSNAAVSFTSTAMVIGNTTDNLTLKIVGNIGFNNTAPISKPTVTGSKGANAALASLLTALASYGLIIDSST